jgi:hypothetical protein
VWLVPQVAAVLAAASVLLLMVAVLVVLAAWLQLRDLAQPACLHLQV